MGIDEAVRRRAWAALLGVATVLAYLPGSARAFDYDGAVTVDLFIRAPLGRALRDQYVSNNHHYFSFLEQLWVRLVGSSSEQSLRVLPICFAGAAVAVVVLEGVRRFGWLPGTVAGVVLATNPLFVELAREVRGYSLLVLCAVLSSSLLLSSSRRWERIAYVAVTALGIGTHLFMVWVLAGHVLYVVVRKRGVGEWVFLWVAAVALGAVPYLLTLDLIVGQGRGVVVDAACPLLVLRDVLGTEPLTVAALAALCALAAWRKRRDRLAVGLAALGVFAVLITWVAPNQPGTRFFVWAVPAVAMGAAAAVDARQVLALAVLPAVVVAVVAVSDGYTDDAIANRRVAPLIEAADRAGQQVCGVGSSTETLYVYLDRPIPGFFDRASFRHCDVAVALVQDSNPDLLRLLRRDFPVTRVVPAEDPALVLSKGPLPSSTTGRRR